MLRKNLDYLILSISVNFVLPAQKSHYFTPVRQNIHNERNPNSNFSE